MKITIKRTDLHKYFFLLFVFFIPFQTRKVFLTDYSFYTGSFTEYGTVFLYLSDLFFLLALLSLVLFNPDIVKYGLSKTKKKSGKSAAQYFFISFLALVGIFFLSTFLHPAYLPVSIFRSLKITESLLLVFFIFCVFRDRRIMILSLFMLILSASFQSIIAIYQFLYQKSIFVSPLFHKLTGETILGPNLPGIAKINEGGEKIIRAYGTFPHPNLLGGFLLFSIFISLYLYFEHKKDYLSSKISFGNPRINSLNKLIIPIFWIAVFFFQFLALILSFSRSAWLGLGIGLFIILALNSFYLKIVSRETILTSLVRKCPELAVSIALIVAICLPNWSLLSSRLTQNTAISNNKAETAINLPQNDTFSDRSFFNIVSRETIHHHAKHYFEIFISFCQVKDAIFFKDNLLKPFSSLFFLKQKSRIDAVIHICLKPSAHRLRFSFCYNRIDLFLRFKQDCRIVRSADLL